jgi:hypothetical protein
LREAPVPENNPSWDERNCSRPHIMKQTAHFNLYRPVLTSPLECLSHSCRVPQCREVRQAKGGILDIKAEHSALMLQGEGQRSLFSLKFHNTFTYYFAYMAQCTPLFAFTVFHLIWGCNNNFFHDYDVFFLPFTVFNAGRRRQQVK